MSAKFSAARKRAFLKALSETGNATVSAECAKVSRSWALLHRANDAKFAAAWEEAIHAARTILRDAATAAPQDERLGQKWKYLDGAELVVRGSNGRRTQIARARLKQWTPRVEERFLAALAATCNVKAACAEVGMFPGSAYRHRHRWPAFATRWDQAVATGYARIEAALVEAGCNLYSEPDVPVDVPVKEMSAEHAIQLLRLHRQAGRGLDPRFRGRPPSAASNKQVRAALIRRLETFGAEVERGEFGWGGGRRKAKE